MPIQINDRIELRDNVTGVVRYIGPVEGKPDEWVGVELSEPVGKNDGSVDNRRYFNCLPRHGLFIKYRRLSKKIADVENMKGTERLEDETSKSNILTNSLESPNFYELNSTKEEAVDGLYFEKSMHANRSLFNNSNDSLVNENIFLKEEVQKYKNMVIAIIGKTGNTIKSVKEGLEDMQRRLNNLKIIERPNSEKEYVVELVSKIFQANKENKPIGKLYDEFMRIMKKNEIPIE